MDFPGRHFLCSQGVLVEANVNCTRLLTFSSWCLLPVAFPQPPGSTGLQVSVSGFHSNLVWTPFPGTYTQAENALLFYVILYAFQFAKIFTYFIWTSGLLMERGSFFSLGHLRTLKFRGDKRMGQHYRDCKWSDCPASPTRAWHQVLSPTQSFWIFLGLPATLLPCLPSVLLPHVLQKLVPASRTLGSLPWAFLGERPSLTTLGTLLLPKHQCLVYNQYCAHVP